MCIRDSDNMALYKENMVQRGHAFAIVDEVDSILIDEARTPLIISGKGEESSKLYEMARIETTPQTVECLDDLLFHHIPYVSDYI